MSKVRLIEALAWKRGEMSWPMNLQTLGASRTCSLLCRDEVTGDSLLVSERTRRLAAYGRTEEQAKRVEAAHRADEGASLTWPAKSRR